MSESVLGKAFESQEDSYEMALTSQSFPISFKLRHITLKYSLYYKSTVFLFTFPNVYRVPIVIGFSPNKLPSSAPVQTPANSSPASSESTLGLTAWSSEQREASTCLQPLSALL